MIQPLLRVETLLGGNQIFWLHSSFESTIFNGLFGIRNKAHPRLDVG